VTVPSCSTCRYYAERHGECRRYAPRLTGRFDFYYGELLQVIAEAQAKMAKLEEIEGAYPENHALSTEVTEAYGHGRNWPYVKEDDWCGEWERKSQGGGEEQATTGDRADDVRGAGQAEGAA
jgi:hypothetical protein